MTTGKIFPNYAPQWLNDENSDCPLLRPVFEAMLAPSNIIIPELTVTGNPFLVQQGPPKTSQKAPALKSVPLSADGTPLSLGTYAVETPPQARLHLQQLVCFKVWIKWIMILIENLLLHHQLRLRHLL